MDCLPRSVHVHCETSVSQHPLWRPAMRCRLPLFVLLALVPTAHADADIAPMKFNDVREIAPGVFFRYSAISVTDPSVVFGGSNNIWVVFKDYVVVFDANFPKE